MIKMKQLMVEREIDIMGKKFQVVDKIMLSRDVWYVVTSDQLSAHKDFVAIGPFASQQNANDYAAKSIPNDPVPSAAMRTMKLVMNGQEIHDTYFNHFIFTKKY